MKHISKKYIRLWWKEDIEASYLDEKSSSLVCREWPNLTSVLMLVVGRLMTYNECQIIQTFHNYHHLFIKYSDNVICESAIIEDSYEDEFYKKRRPKSADSLKCL